MNARQLPRRDYLRLKASTRDLISAAGGPTRGAELTRSSQSRLSEAMAPHCEDRFLCIDQVADLEAEVGQPVMTRTLAALAGFHLVPIREVRCPQQGFLDLLSRLLDKGGDVATALAMSIADGVITPDEAKLLRQSIATAQTVLAELAFTLDAHEVSDVRG